MKQATIINVSNRLPITISDEGIRKSSGGLVAALQGAVDDGFGLRWVGWPGNEVEEQRQQEVRDTLEQEHRLTPVFLPGEQAEGHYGGFSNSSLWPLLHYMPSKLQYEPHWWEAYEAVNRQFAEQVLSLVETGDEPVWVHDYHLMLLPRMLRQARPSLRIGFFLHTPFPAYEIWRCHPRREELVDGILGADLIGFHTFGYLRHFRSTAMHLLDVEPDLTQIRHEDARTSTLGVYPIGIHAEKFRRELEREEFSKTFNQLRDTHGGKRLVLSVERLDYTKGLLRRLDAIELFLKESGRAEEMTFMFIAVPSREDVEEYHKLIEEVELRVGHINGTYASISNSPVQFVHHSVEFTELCALYALAEVALVTPVVDGMNMVAKEYVALQRDTLGEGPDVKPGVLILSEFAGAAEVLYDALIVNPYDAHAVVDALTQALEMPPQERARRMRGMRERVMRFDAAWWARAFVGDLAKISASEAELSPNAQNDPQELQQRLGDALAEGRRVGLFLDYDGTLREIVRDPDAAVPSGDLRRLLENLRDHKNLSVTVISGRTPEDLERFVGDFDSFALIAEHGASLRRPGQREWEQLDRNVSYEWKEQVGNILRLYEPATPGSFIEDKRTSLVWHYRRADPEFGQWKARQLVSELEAVVANESLQVRHGRKIVEITNSYINKGAAVSRLLEEADYDLVLVAGDDTTDESMYGLQVENLVSVNVGPRSSQAQYVLADPARFRRLLSNALDQATSGAGNRR